ncbi:uncharacterized protein BJX67DRAFT_350440 [Aspergillus lucknowensis]|uniref:Mitochondrial mRNA-processing protein COX24 C-terminal domain-containing protein n=1 Tax=Aspergillus lucknowensis TaxID=176173 RepID=A0ABR4LVV8_9EURO
MKGRLVPAYLLRPSCRSCLGSSFVDPHLTRISCQPRRCFGRCHSVVKRHRIGLDILEEYYRLSSSSEVLSATPPLKSKTPGFWISFLNEKFLRKYPGRHFGRSLTRNSFMWNMKLSYLLLHARSILKTNLLAHLGFKLNNWSVVFTLFSRLLDAAEGLKEVSPNPKSGVVDFWASSVGLSLDQLTDQRFQSFPRLSTQNPNSAPFSGLTNLDALTRTPFAQYHYATLMAEVWKSLGEIVLTAADAPPNESKLAMSCVYRILARLHHSGVISERVYKYTAADVHQTTFRPPGMHLLFTHIMDVLSDAAWLAHENEAAAEAAVTGQDSPFLPVKIGIKELGHEIWIEFILWCCVEHGHIKEGAWLIDQMKSRVGDMAWKFQSWEPLLRDQELLFNLKIDREVSWNLSGLSDIAAVPRTQSNPAPFLGMGRRTVSAEVVLALLDNVSNEVYVSPGRGMRSISLLSHLNGLKFAILPTMDEPKLLPTTKATNWLATRVIESGGLNPNADPQTFDDFLRVTTCLIPPWSITLGAAEGSLAQLRPSQLYDGTSAFVGLMEHNLRCFCSHQLLRGASNMFAMLQDVFDSSKILRIDEFFSAHMEYPSASVSTEYHGSLPSLKLFESSNPQISNVTLAKLLDLITASRTFEFGEWLLFSDDIDGPAVPASAYGDQALAPSILRFAAATKNITLGESVFQSLTPPLSGNTIRTLCIYHITMHEWDMVASLLAYIRDYRLKSWTHSSIATLAAEIVRLEHRFQQQQSSKQSRAAASNTKRNISQAKEILRRILTGEFHEIPHRIRPSNHQVEAVLAFHRLFSDMSSPSLREVASHVPLTPVSFKTRDVYIPTPSFHLILAADVEARGSSSGQRLYKRFCASLNSPALRAIQEAGRQRPSAQPSQNPGKGEPNYDSGYARHLHNKMVFPNINTVKIIARAAREEYDQACAATRAQSVEAKHATTEMVAETEMDGIPPTPQPQHDSGFGSATSPAAQSAKAETTLFFCIQRFELMGMSEFEIIHEVGAAVYQKYRELWGKRKRRLRRRKRTRHKSRRRYRPRY